MNLSHRRPASRPTPTEAVYGLGQRQSGSFNYRGSVVELGQDNTKVAISLMVSSEGYAIPWNTASFSYFENRIPRDLTFESMAADPVDVYPIYGPSKARIAHECRSMTGHFPLFPERAYGFFQSKDRHKINPCEKFGLVRIRRLLPHLPHPQGRCRSRAHQRHPQKRIPGHADQPHLQRGLRNGRPRRGTGCHKGQRQGRSLCRSKDVGALPRAAEQRSRLLIA
jgi:hypothetical protein